MCMLYCLISSNRLLKLSSSIKSTLRSYPWIIYFCFS
jgi:hypothetical protein